MQDYPMHCAMSCCQQRQVEASVPLQHGAEADSHMSYLYDLFLQELPVCHVALPPLLCSQCFTLLVLSQISLDTQTTRKHWHQCSLFNARHVF